MGSFEHSEVSLRFGGETADPDEITRLLGASPTLSYRKGDTIQRHGGEGILVRSRGLWCLSAARREPADVDAQILEILDQVTPDLAVWASLKQYDPDFFVGLFMESGNDGIALSPEVLLAMGQRGVTLDLDVYDASD